MRIRAIDWTRGLVMLLMTVDHSGNIFDDAHMHGDNGATWIPGSALPAGEFLTRWVSHLCAPTFVLLAGASLALSAEKRRDDAGQTRFIVTRGLLIALLDPIWMSLGFATYHVIIAQVLYAIGMSMVCMAWLRKLSSRALLVSAIAIQLLDELPARVHLTGEPLHSVWTYLFAAGTTFGRWRCGYPLVPWLSFMMLGWVLGRWLLEPRSQSERARSMLALGGGLLAVFAVVRGIDGYGNGGLHKDSPALLQWLHVAKYPPSLSFATLELGVAFLFLGGFTAIDDPAKPRTVLAPLTLLGATAFFFYLLHVHLMRVAQAILEVDTTTHGLEKTWIGAALTVLLLLFPCVLYRRYKAAHPNGWTRYI